MVDDPLGIQPAAPSFLLAAPTMTPIAPLADVPTGSPLLTPEQQAAVDKVRGWKARGAAGTPASPAVVASAVAPAAPSWYDGITPGRDSSGPVVLDVLHPEVKKAMVGLLGDIGPYTVTSAAGGGHAKNSQHYEDNAIDVATAGMSPEQLSKAVESAKARGFTGIGLANDHLHLDMRPGGVVVFPDNSGGRYSMPTEWAGKPIAEWQRALMGGGAGGVSSPPAHAPGSFYSTLSQIESSGQNIFSKIDPDVAGPGSRSQGYFQINTPTWRDFAPKEVLAKYPNAMSAPEEVQRAVVANIPLSRFGPRTQRMLQTQYGFGDEAKGKTIGELAAAYGGGGSGAVAGGGGGGSVPRAPSATDPTALFAREMKLTLIRNMFPKHDIQQVGYDPFKVLPGDGAAGRKIDVNEGIG